MQPSDKPKQELQYADAALEVMRAAQSLADFEEAWKELLRRIDRAWNKTEAHFSKSPKWHSWVGPIVTARKTDPLLSYLSNARNADEHTVGDITAKTPMVLAINAKEEGTKLHIDYIDGAFQVQSTKHVDVEFTPARIELVPAVNRGRTYPVPTKHLGRAIDPTNVLALAADAVAFYRRKLDEAERYFVR